MEELAGHWRQRFAAAGSLLATFDPNELTHAQIETVKGSVKKHADYFKALAGRMAAKGFGDSNPVVVAAQEAHEKAHALWTRLHYLSIEAFSREFDAAEKTTKLRRRFRGGSAPR